MVRDTAGGGMATTGKNEVLPVTPSDTASTTTSPSSSSHTMPTSQEQEQEQEQQQPPSAFEYDPYPRLSLHTPIRVTLGTISACFIGFGLGAATGGKMAQLRFRAEHAHKMPDTTAGWYLYHKTKNYHSMQGGIREGFKMSATTGGLAFMALSLESTVDGCRGSSDMFSTMIATLTVAGGFSLWNRLSIPAAARTARHGLVFGAIYGGFQDLVGLGRGRPIGYVEGIRRRFGRQDVKEELIMQ